LEIAEGGFPVVAGSGLLRVVDLSSALAGSETFNRSTKSEIFAGSKKFIFHLFDSKFKAKLYIKLIFGGKNEFGKYYPAKKILEKPPILFSQHSSVQLNALCQKSKKSTKISLKILTISFARYFLRSLKRGKGQSV
jgi:hypothetical protein